MVKKKEKNWLFKLKELGHLNDLKKFCNPQKNFTIIIQIFEKEKNQIKKSQIKMLR